MSREITGNPASDEAMDEPRVRVLRAAGLFLVAGPSIYLALLLAVFPGHALRAAGPAVVLVLAAAALLVLRAGRARTAAGLLIYGGWCGVAVAAVLGGGVHAPQIIALPLAVVLAGWLLGRHHAVAIALLSVLTWLALATAAHLQVLPPVPPAPALLAWIAISIVTSVACLLIIYIVRTHESDLEEVRRLGAELSSRVEELAAERTQLHLLAESVPAMIAYHDREFVLRYANRHYMDFFGLDERTVGNHVREIIGAEAFLKVRPLLQRSLDGEAVRYRAMRRSAAGAEHVIEVELVPDRGPEGVVRGAYALMRDITDQQRAEDEVRRLNAELESRVTERTAELTAANRELESFAYSISHDLRAPLRGIDGFSQLLADEYRDRLDAQGVNYLDRVRRAAQRMGNLIDDILELSRVTRQEMRRVRVDLSQIAGEVIEEHLRTGPGHRTEVTIAPACTTSGDPQLLRVLMQNLLENAWKYSAKADAPKIEFGSATENGERVFYVRDNGVGFDMKYAGRLFSPFQRLHSPEEFEGTGIGLATVARIAIRHGGRVWAEAAPNEGATFKFTLPG